MNNGIQQTISGIDGSLAYQENDGPVTIEGTISVSDVDDSQLDRAEVTIASNFAAGEDLLACPATGLGCTRSGATLEIDGAATVVGYRSVLEGVTYENTSNAPSEATRTVEFRVRDATGEWSTVNADARKSIAVTAVADDAPVLSGFSPVLGYTEGDGDVTVESTIGISDPDNTQLGSATVSITAGSFRAGEDVLACPPSPAVACSEDSARQITLTGPASLSDFAATLQAITYGNDSDDPTEGTRTVAFRVTDTGGIPSGMQTRDISVGAVNDPPSIDASGPTNVTEDQAYSFSVPVSDVDDASFTFVKRNAGGWPSWLSLDTTTGLIAGTPTEGQTGGTVDVGVDDGSGGTATRSWSVSVTAVNDAPVITSSALEQVVEEIQRAAVEAARSDEVVARLSRPFPATTGPASPKKSASGSCSRRCRTCRPGSSRCSRSTTGGWRVNRSTRRSKARSPRRDVPRSGFTITTLRAARRDRRAGADESGGQRAEVHPRGLGHRAAGGRAGR